MKILVTGGCGYVGHVLVPKLLAKLHEVCVVDIQWFGNYLKPHSNLIVIKKDIRTLDYTVLEGIDCIIHLASIANDPCSELDAKLSWEIGAFATMQLAELAKKAAVKQFIYASSGSVYGVSDADQVTEDLELNPLSDYNKTKMVAERILLSYQNDFITQIVRPATVAGYSPRMRLDVVVNMLTMQALTSHKIKVLGGTQIRPNIHIDDLTDLYLYLLDHPELSGIYNAGFENLAVLQIAELIAEFIPAEITVAASNDPRSYRLNSNKLLQTGFQAKKSVRHAIDEIKEKYEAKVLKDNAIYHNLQWMEATILKGN
jgi:nucleoside-diphosphate-sugar epimerase